MLFGCPAGFWSRSDEESYNNRLAAGEWVGVGKLHVVTMSIMVLSGLGTDTKPHIVQLTFCCTLSLAVGGRLGEGVYDARISAIGCFVYAIIHNDVNLSLSFQIVLFGRL